MNLFMRQTILTMIINADQFNRNLELAARKDDGTIDEEELKIIKKIRKLNRRYVKALKKLSTPAGSGNTTEKQAKKEN